MESSEIQFNAKQNQPWPENAFAYKKKRVLIFGKHRFKPKNPVLKAFPQEFLRIYWFRTAFYISGSAQGRDFRKIQTPLTSSKMLQFTWNCIFVDKLATSKPPEIFRANG